MPSISFLHTAEAHIPTFEGLARSRSQAVATRHRVEPALLADALAAGSITPAVAARVADAVRAAGAGADVVLCTCSTIGGAAEAAGRALGITVLRVDRVMAEAAVALGRRILVAVTVASTIAPTRTLLEDVATAAGCAVDLRLVMVAGGFALFQAGDLAGYVAAIDRAVRAALGDAEVVVLAQASMAGAAAGLADLGRPVLTSTALGVARALALASAGSPAATAG
jgi:hypothetical protein